MNSPTLGLRVASVIFGLMCLGNHASGGRNRSR
jgi:hypothetical protein